MIFSNILNVSFPVFPLCVSVHSVKDFTAAEVAILHNEQLNVFLA